MKRQRSLVDKPFNLPRLFTETLAFSALFGLLPGCAATMGTELVEHRPSTECVVLLHGLNRSSRAMRKMADSLQQDGYSTANVNYPSTSASIEKLAPMVVNEGVRECQHTGARRVHFVTHSIGGILLRYAHSQQPIAQLGRVVMLGPPNQGSEVIDKTRHWPGVAMISGESGLQLGTDKDSIPSQLGPVDFELGVIAGNRTNNLLMSAMLPDADDGKVTVARTRVEGMNDFEIVERSHYRMMKSDDVIRDTIWFLRTGAFTGDDPAEPTEPGDSAHVMDARASRRPPPG